MKENDYLVSVVWISSNFFYPTSGHYQDQDNDYNSTNIVYTLQAKSFKKSSGFNN